jgi:hypothetical protein
MPAEFLVDVPEWKTGIEVLQERARAAGITLKNSIGEDIFAALDLPMLVHCTHCQETMSMPAAHIDRRGRTFCPDCSGYEPLAASPEDSTRVGYCECKRAECNRGHTKRDCRSVVRENGKPNHFGYVTSYGLLCGNCAYFCKPEEILDGDKRALVVKAQEYPPHIYEGWVVRDGSLDAGFECDNLKRVWNETRRGKRDGYIILARLDGSWVRLLYFARHHKRWIVEAYDERDEAIEAAKEFTLPF